MSDTESSAFKFINTSAPSRPGKSELTAIRSHVSRANAAARAIATAATSTIKKKKKVRKDRHANTTAKPANSELLALRQSDIPENIREQVVRRSLATHLHHGLDPLSLHPEFNGSKPRTKQLLHHASDVLLRIFDSWKYWRQAVISSAAAFTGYSVLASVHLDMLYGVPGESPQTLKAKGQAMRLINKRLGSPETQYDEVTMLAVTAMQAVEMLSGENSAQQAHIKGVDMMIKRRGGPKSFVQQGGLAVEIVRSHVVNVLYVSILNELKPPGFWTQFWEPIAPERPNISAGQLISPLNCPDDDLYTILSCSECSNHTYALLVDMKNLFDTVMPLQPLAVPSLDSPQLKAKTEHLLARFKAAPSAADPSAKMHGDWVYESCRIVALLTTTALYHRVPLSQATKLLQESQLAASGSQNISPTEQLWNALSKTPLTTRWDGLFGVLIWVALTGAAASRNVDAGNSNAVIDHAEDTARRWIVMAAGSCMAILNTAQAWGFRANLLRIIRLQELLGSEEWALSVSYEEE